jgi:transcriptional regulator with XRE-family HTH domain
MIIVDLIKELMYQQNKSVREVANESGLPYNTIHNIVNNDVIPNPSDAQKILKVLGVSLEEVLSLY